MGCAGDEGQPPKIENSPQCAQQHHQAASCSFARPQNHDLPDIRRSQWLADPTKRSVFFTSLTLILRGENDKKLYP